MQYQTPDSSFYCFDCYSLATVVQKEALVACDGSAATIGKLANQASQEKSLNRLNRQCKSAMLMQILAITGVCCIGRDSHPKMITKHREGGGGGAKALCGVR